MTTTIMVTEQELSSRMQTLLEDVQQGAEIVISRSGKPLARLLQPYAMCNFCFFSFPSSSLGTPLSWKLRLPPGHKKL